MVCRYRKADCHFTEHKTAPIARCKVAIALFSPSGIHANWYRLWWLIRRCSRGRISCLRIIIIRSLHPKLKNARFSPLSSELVNSRKGIRVTDGYEIQLSIVCRRSEQVSSFWCKDHWARPLDYGAFDDVFFQNSVGFVGSKLFRGLVRQDNMHCLPVKQYLKLVQFGAFQLLFVSGGHPTRSRVLLAFLGFRVCASRIFRQSSIPHDSRGYRIHRHFVGRSSVDAFVGNGRGWLVVQITDGGGTWLRHWVQEMFINFIVDNLKGRWALNCDSLMICQVYDGSQPIRDQDTEGSLWEYINDYASLHARIMLTKRCIWVNL